MSHNISRIRKVSRIFKVLFSIWFILTPFSYILYWVFFNVLPDPLRSIDLPGIINHTLPPKVRLLAFLASLIPMSIDMAGTFMLIKLFSLYEKGIIFAAANVKYFGRLGSLLILWSLASALYEVVVANVLIGSLSHEQTIIAISLQFMNLTTLIIGVVIVVISWVMDEGRELEDEHALTI